MNQRFALLLVITLVLGVGLGLGLSKYVIDQEEDEDDGMVSEKQILKDSTYQALFLSDGDVYFGKIGALTAESVTLNKVYYLKEARDLQTSDAEATASPDFQLVKLGNQELHGPEDTMIVNREHVLFWENLKEDSAVVKAIKDFEQKGQ